MGKPRIVLRPTPILRKTSGQLKKLFGLWENSSVDTTSKLPNKANPMPTIKEGRPTFLNNNQNVTTGFITRRQIVLNRHFTEIISDVLAVNLRKELSEMNVNITSIETKAWNKGVRIFYATYKPFNSEIHDELNQLVSKLKSAITERRLIGRTPNINFVYDRLAQLNHNIEAIFKNIEVKSDNNVSSIENISLDQLQLNYTHNKQSSKEVYLDPKDFSAPDDMTNMMLGLDHKTLYNEVANKLASGRGESSRKLSNSAIASAAKPLFKAPLDQEGVEDSRARVLNMHKFLVMQKKKNEYLAKLRRKEELLFRDQYKWDLPDENDV